MKAIYLPDARMNIEKGYNLVVVKLDKHSLAHLVRGEPLTLGFFTDDKTHLPDLQRSVIKIIIGTQDDLIDKYERTFDERKPQDGMLDKSYLFSAMREIKDKLLSLLSRELGMNVVIEPMDNPIFRDRNQYELFTVN